MKQLKIVVLMLVFLLLSTGCSEDLHRYSKPLRSSDYGSLKAKKAEQAELDHNRILPELEAHLASPLPPASEEPDYSSELANLVSSIPGVADARVFTAGSNAYISVVLDYTGQGILKSKPSGDREDARTRLDTGQWDLKDEAQDAREHGDASNMTPLTNESSIHNNPFRYYLTVNDNSQLSDRFLRTVTDSVQAKQPSIENVHISANKEFMYYMDEFAQVVWGGESLQAYEKQFKILIDHQFFNGKVMPTSLKYYRGD